MNKAIIESIEWHKDQLFKLLEDDDLYKIEGDIQSVKSNLDEIIEKAKKRVWVKPTATRKGHYREQEVGQKDGEVGKKPKLSDLDNEIKSLTGKIDTLTEQREDISYDSPGAEKKIDAMDDKIGALVDKRDLVVDSYSRLQHEIDPKKKSKYSSR